MKRIFLALVILLASAAAYSQTIQDIQDISGNIRVLDPWVCGAGNEFGVYIDPQGIGGLRTNDTYYKLLDPNSPVCQFDVEAVFENNSLKCDGGTIRRDPNDPQTVYIKANGNRSYTITWQFRIFRPTNNCGASKMESYSFTGTTRVVNVIPTPKTPTISVIKPVLRPGETTYVNFSGCPNTFLDLGYSRNPITGQPTYGTTEFSRSCTENGKPDFVNGFFQSDMTSTTNFGPGVTTYYARCNDNGCIGNAYSTARVISQYTTPTCGDPKMDEIDSYRQDSRPDYHSYTIETVVCNKANGDPNCTQQKVYELMKSRKDYNVFNASDEHVGNVFPVFQQTAKTQIQLIGAEAVFQIPSTPVANCETVNLIGPLSLGMNLLTLKAVDITSEYYPVGLPPALGAAILSQLATRQTILPFANPIAQFIDNQSFSVTNYTKKGHALYPGKVVRTVVEDCGQIKIVTIGVGRNFATDTGPLIALLYPPLAPVANEIATRIGVYMGKKNKETGQLLFKDVDNRFVKDFNLR